MGGHLLHAARSQRQVLLPLAHTLALAHTHTLALTLTLSSSSLRAVLLNAAVSRGAVLCRTPPEPRGGVEVSQGPLGSPALQPCQGRQAGGARAAPAEFCDLGQRSFSRRQARLGLRGRGARQGSSRGRVAHGVCAVPRPPLPALFPFVTVP